MVVRRLKQLFLGVAILPLLIQPTFAHIVMFHHNNGEYKLWYSEPEDSKSGVYDPKSLTSFAAYDQARSIVPAKVLQTSGAVSIVPQKEIAALIASFDHGLWLGNAMDVEHNSSQRISKKQAEAIRYANVMQELKSTKAFYSWSESFKQPFGLQLEIVPLENPFNVEAGKALPIQVLFKGRVVKDAEVEYLGKEQSINAQGIAYIPIGKEGLQPIEVNYTDPRASNPRIFYTTSLTAQLVTNSSPDQPRTIESPRMGGHTQPH